MRKRLQETPVFGEAYHIQRLGQRNKLCVIRTYMIGDSQVQGERHIDHSLARGQELQGGSIP